MKTRLTISLDSEHGEADLTPASRRYVEEMVEDAELGDYDLMSDMFHTFRDAFERLQVNYDRKALERAQQKRLRSTLMGTEVKGE